MEKWVCKIELIEEMSSLLASELMLPMDKTSPKAAGSLFPLNVMLADPFSMTITNCTLYHTINNPFKSIHDNGGIKDIIFKVVAFH